MPSPREQALSIGTVREKFPADPIEPPQNQEFKEQDYRANPTNPADPAPPVSNLKEVR